MVGAACDGSIGKQRPDQSQDRHDHDAHGACLVLLIPTSPLALFDLVATGSARTPVTALASYESCRYRRRRTAGRSDSSLGGCPCRLRHRPLSLPLKPLMMSLPPWPSITSLPDPPWITSLLGPPRNPSTPAGAAERVVARATDRTSIPAKPSISVVAFATGGPIVTQNHRRWCRHRSHLREDRCRPPRG